eukprot:7646155-Heterocapsa_arctica.AAC.1
MQHNLTYRNITQHHTLTWVDGRTVHIYGALEAVGILINRRDVSKKDKKPEFVDVEKFAKKT